MKLFQKIQNQPNTNSFKRIQLAYEAGLAERALNISLQQGQLTDFDNVFCLDIVRTASSHMFPPTSGEIESFLFRPNTWQELIESISEVVEFNQLKVNNSKTFGLSKTGLTNNISNSSSTKPFVQSSPESAGLKTTLVLNDLSGLIYLFNSYRNQGNINGGINTLAEFFLQLKFVSDQINLILLSGNNSSTNSMPSSFFKNKNTFDVLHDFSPHLVLELINTSKLIVSLSALPEWSIGEDIELSDNMRGKRNFSDSTELAKPLDNESSPELNPELNLNQDLGIQLPEFQVSDSQINALQSIGSGLKTNILKKVSEIDNLDSPDEASGENLLTSGDNENKNDKGIIVIYESLLSKLAEAKGKIELLEVRKEIQSLSSILSAQQKVALNEIYKIHLQRIKLIEGSFSETLV